MIKATILPDAVFLDLDDTLYSYEPCHAEASKQTEKKFAELTSVSIGEFTEALSLAKEQVKFRLGATAASHSRLLYFKRTLEILGLGNSFEVAISLEHTYWQTFLDQMKLNAGVREFLNRLKDLGIPVVILTDLTTEIQLRKIISLELDKLVTFILTSEEVGFEKPDARPFIAAKELVGITAKSIWMIGDSEGKDIAGANAQDSFVSIQKINVPGSTSKQVHVPMIEFVEFFELTELLESLASKSVEPS